MKLPELWTYWPNSKPKCACYQNCLALDYLFAFKGGVCRKFNLSNCCLQIDDETKVIEEITDGMTKVTHVPVRTWKVWDPQELFGGWFSTLVGGWREERERQRQRQRQKGRFKTLMGIILLILGACLILPCLAPLVIQSVSSLIKVMVERKMATHVMMLWEYKPLNQDARWCSLTQNRRSEHQRGECGRAPP